MAPEETPKEVMNATSDLHARLHRRGDTVEMENCYQHAEHFFRTMRS